MKRILISTDFSAVSENAVQYIMFLLGDQPCEFNFVYAYYTFPCDGETMVAFNFFKDIYRCAKVKMRLFMEKAQKADTLRIHRFQSLLLSASPAGAINFMSYQSDFDLVVTGAKNQRKDIFFGNMPADIVRLVPLNTIVVPELTVVRPIKNILLAIDAHEPCLPGNMKELKTLLRNHDASLTVLRVCRQQNQEQPVNQNAVDDLYEYFRGFTLSEYQIPALNLEEGMRTYFSFQDAHMLVLINRKRSFFELPFNSPAPVRFALRPSIPLLSIYQKSGKDIANREIVNF